MTLISFTALNLYGLPAAARGNDHAFLKKFLNYRAQNKTSTLKTAESLAAQYKKSTDQILARFIRTQFSEGKNPELAVVFGVEAFLEQGLSMEQSLSKVSDLTGQMTTTLESMYNSSRFNKRETASVKKKLAS